MVEIFNWRPHSWTVGIGPQEQYLWVWWQVVQTRDWDGPGLHLIVDYANIFMAKIDDKILKTTELLFQDSDKIKMFKRFLDNR